MSNNENAGQRKPLPSKKPARGRSRDAKPKQPESSLSYAEKNLALILSPEVDAFCHDIAQILLPVMGDCHDQSNNSPN